jgi:ribosome-associated translation inhibitor RaiA
MEISISAKGVLLTDADETYIRNRLCFGLAANHRDVEAVEVSVCSAPGAGSAIRHRCRVDIGLVDGTAAIGDSMEDNLYVAIDQAADRACCAITRNVDMDWRIFSRTEAPGEDRRSLAA